MTVRPVGVEINATGVHFSLLSHHASAAWLCLFDATGDIEIARHEMQRIGDDRFAIHVENITVGQRYGYRVDGPWQPHLGHRFDKAKLLIDPYATLLDRPFVYHADLGKRGVDTAMLVPKAILEEPYKFSFHVPVKPKAGGLIYEVPVKAFTILNEAIPEAIRGTLAAIAHPASIAHFKKMGVATVELMPITAWIDERHLAPLHLTNAWGYNPVAFMALDPRLAPGGIADLRHVADTLHAYGIALILDVVFNHTGESDVLGPVLSLRGLDNALYYAHQAGDPSVLINDTGTGNTIAANRAPVRDLILQSLRHFVSIGGVDGFRFDLCTVLGRTENGFSPQAPLFAAMRDDPLLSQAHLIAEPWDIGPGGYQLGQFPSQFLEWNDRFRDDVRRFWRGDANTLGALATRLTGSSDYFAIPFGHTRTVNFLSAHDGFTLADITAYCVKHNIANGENNRDGHDENFSWNHGVEGDTLDPDMITKRLEDIKALLILLFIARGTPLLCAGDEFGRSQNGNNNAYAQNNEITWLDWAKRNVELEDFVANLSALRAKHRTLASTSLLSGLAPLGFQEPDICWFRADGQSMTTYDWENGANQFIGLILSLPAQGKQIADKIAIVVNRKLAPVSTHIPLGPNNQIWRCAISSKPIASQQVTLEIPSRCVAVFEPSQVIKQKSPL